MADNTTLNSGTGGDVIAADDIGPGVKYQRIKVTLGADGVNDGDVASGNPMPVTGTITAVTSLTNALPAGSNAIGKLAANSGVDIGDVDVTSLPATVHSADFDTGGGTDTTLAFGIAVPASGGAAVVPGDATAGLKVDLGADNDVTVTGTVTANLAAGTNTNEMVGDVAHDAAIAGNPVTIGGVASAAAPTDVSADQDAVRAWFLRNGAQATVVTAAGALIGGDATNGLDVDVTRLPALAAGTNNIGDVDILSIAAGDNNIGNVDVVTLPNVTLAAGTNTNEVVGDVAHDAAVAGNPVLIAGVAQAHDDTAPPNRVSAESDATRLVTDFDGALFVRPHGPQVWTYHLNTSTAQTDASVHAAPGAGLSLYVGTIVFSSGAATAINLFLEEGASTVMGPYYLEATAGRGMAITFNPPRKITANTALTLTTSASIAHAVDITGFTAQG